MTNRAINIDSPDSPLRPNVSIAIETSGRTGSAAIACEDAILDRATLSGFQKHSSELLPAIQSLLSRHGLSANNIQHIYLPKGPGSFTGIRIAVTFAKMAAFSMGAKIIAVNTLDALAHNALYYMDNTNSDIQRIATILDAKKGYFYIAVFNKNDTGLHRMTEDLLITPAAFLSDYCEGQPKMALLGEGLVYYHKHFEHPNTVILDKSCWPANAVSVWHVARPRAKQGQFDDPNTLVPLYIRRPEAEENWEKARQIPQTR
ncbi:MAG TPA: tRNA (adenosine(37)-N6)-threonylcarbamoyltransferase complex dimerization subunit type 1 TsaB [Anaerohalosphaeraceae bacterium]|nr:tRNA (adenosine(37)-N6)-threonylcarbamoyltransferase complex dimerization subunit type 1 TsaB [Anaerohalosphaeraceae bacterium]